MRVSRCQAEVNFGLDDNITVVTTDSVGQRLPIDVHLLSACRDAA
jgi:hypothetical protein